MVPLIVRFPGSRGIARALCRAWAALFVAALLCAGVPEATAQGIAKLSPADKSDLSRIEAYLNRLTTMRSRFLQVASNGDYSEGTVYFAKPGKMRLEYDLPKQILIVSDGVNLAYFDKVLQQVSYFDLQSTQASILLKKHISFSEGDVLVTAFERGAGVLRLTVIKSNAPFEGNLTLIFSDNPLDLKKWTVTDAQGVITNVSLLGPRFDVKLDTELFKFEPPQDSLTIK
jgi:outer membrane lipoprotein-sorting protein